MKRPPLAVAATAAIALAGCSGGDAHNDVTSNEVGETVTQPAMVDEPAIPANPAEARRDERTSARSVHPSEPEPTVPAREAAPHVAPKAVHREQRPVRTPAPALEEEPVDLHTGHDMPNMSH